MSFTETSDFGLSFPAQTFSKVISSLGARLVTRFHAAGITSSSRKPNSPGRMIGATTA